MAATTVSLALPAVANQTWTERRARYADPLPQAQGAEGTVAYALAGQSGAARPSWLDFDADSRVMSGTPPAAAAAVTLVYSATDDNGTPANASDDATVTKNFTLTVNGRPRLASGVAHQTYTAGRAISTLQLPTATGGTAPLTYTLEGQPTEDGALPRWMTFNGSASPPTVHRHAALRRRRHPADLLRDRRQRRADVGGLQRNGGGGRRRGRHALAGQQRLHLRRERLFGLCHRSPLTTPCPAGSPCSPP